MHSVKIYKAQNFIIFSKSKVLLECSHAYVHLFIACISLLQQSSFVTETHQAASLILDGLQKHSDADRTRQCFNYHMYHVTILFLISVYP